MPELDATVLCALQPILGSLGTRGGEALCPWVAVECCVRTNAGGEQYYVYEVRAACELPTGLLLRQPRAWSSPVDCLLYDGVPASMRADADDGRADEPNRSYLMDSYELCVAPAVAEEEEAEEEVEGGGYASRMRLLSACGMCDGDSCRPLHLTANPLAAEVDRVLVVLALCAVPFHTCPGAYQKTLVIVI